MRVIVGHGGGVFGRGFGLVVLLQLRACAFGLWDGGSDAVCVLCGVGFFGFGRCRFDACSVVGQYSVRLVASGLASCQRCVSPLQGAKALCFFFTDG